MRPPGAGYGRIGPCSPAVANSRRLRVGRHTRRSSISKAPSALGSTPHDGGKTWSRVPTPNLGAFTAPSEVLNVIGTQPVVGFNSNRHVCAKAGGEMYELLAGHRWHTIGCRYTEQGS